MVGLQEAELCTELKAYEAALAAYDRALDLDPTNADAWTNKGGMLRSLGRDDEAVVAYARALELDPTNATNWYRKGIVLWNLRAI